MAEYCAYLQAGTVPSTMDRLVLDVLLQGNAGVLGGGELKITASGTDMSINVAPGRCAIPAGVLVSGIPVEGTYVGANTTVKNIPLPGSGAAGQNRTDIIVGRIYDNVLFAGDSQSVFQTEYLQGSWSSANPAPAPVPTYSHYTELAEVRINALASSPTLVVDKRGLANPRKLDVYLKADGGANNDAIGSSYVDWPGACHWTVNRPSWATTAQFEVDLMGLLAISGGPTWINIQMNVDGQLSQHNQLGFPADMVNLRPPNFRLVDSIPAVPANAQNVWKLQGLRGGAGALRWDGNSSGRLKVTYIEGLT